MAKKIEHVSVETRVDALLPFEMALACEAAGAAKAGRDALTLFVLGILAGAFIALGAVFMTVVATGADALPWGVARLLGGVAFSLGLILVIVGGAELFTGDSLMVVAYASRKITLAALLRAWALVYLGNLAGALATASLVFLSGHYALAGGAVGKTILMMASGKAALPTVQLFFLSLLCNVLVCLAVWMSIAARSTADKVLVIVPPIAAFVAAGFEHSIANVFLLPYALMILVWGGADISGATVPTARLYEALTASNVLHNIGVSTVGNLIGGSVLVGGVYWFLYLRRSRG
jgi:formate/nitrite transporter